MVRQVERALKANSAWWWKTHGGAVRGVPDLLVCIDGRFVALEGKRPNENLQPTQIQEYRIEKIRAAGGIAEVVRSVTDLETILERYNLGGK